jgi:hypothetical protein
MPKRGPKTPAGRRRSALNALTHGVLARTPVIPGVETEADWDRHLAGVTEGLQPANPFEAFFVERIAWTAWRLRRLEAAETELLSIAQDRAEEQAAARILYPNGGAVSLHATAAAALIQARIANLQRLSDLLHRLQGRAPGWTQVSAGEVQLLYEGLALALQPAPSASGDLPRHVIAELTEEPPEDADEAWNSALSVRAVLAEMDEMIDEARASATGGIPSGPSDLAPPFELPLERPRSTDFLDRYPATLVLIRLASELPRLEAELLDLDATISRIRREALVLDAPELARLTRYEAHLRRQLVQYLHELEARQAARRGHPSPLTRLDLDLALTPG